MADAGVNIKTSTPEKTEKPHLETNSNATVGEIEFQASQVIERLEEAVEKAEDGGGGSNSGQSWKTSPGFLPLPSKSTEEILTVLEDLIIHEDPSNRVDSTEDDESLSHNVASIPQLDAISRLAIVTQSIAAYASGLERSHLQKLITRITSDTTRWLSHLFRITRMMLHYKYPKYLEDGFEALSLHPPVIYSSMASPLGVVQHICRQLGLPMSCVRPVPCNTLFGSQQKMDVAALERLIDEDKAAEKVPLIVLADAGTTIAGHVDNLPRLQELCKQHDIWLHLRGHSLAALAMVSIPNVTLYRLFDSAITRQARPVSTVGVARESTLPLVAGLTSDSFSRRLNCLSLWTVLQALGREGVQSRIRQAFESSEHIWKRLSKYQCLRLLSQQPGGEGGTYAVAELVTKPMNTSLLFEVVACTVVFQFIPVNNGEPVEGRVPPYYDKLNSWLGQILQRDASQIPIEICELETNGVVLRYCPLEMGTDRQPSLDDIEAFVQCVEQQLDILTATVQHKETFQQLVTSNPRLRLVEMPGWAGLGGVRYVPEAWEQLLTDQAREELNRLNMQLVEQLRSTDAAFSLGEGADGLVCVRFGMVTAETDVEELLGLVVGVGQEVEESSKFIETMTEIVKKGIETATLDLQKENEERLWQEGILRHVPVFGSLVNWWSPPSKEGGIKGRSLNLTAGIVESTENIYRYHMQLQQGAAPGPRPPPLPQVQTSVAPAGGKHSRSSSHSSQHSQQIGSNPPPPPPQPVVEPAVQAAATATS
ncbi:Uncharacterized protein GBIM_09930 [Gryllus bimaculatus]|nr:Uncharacterized protein GBIM_09930 [Gryllus bimaculatus]